MEFYVQEGAQLLSLTFQSTLLLKEIFKTNVSAVLQVENGKALTTAFIVKRPEVTEGFCKQWASGMLNLVKLIIR